MQWEFVCRHLFSQLKTFRYQNPPKHRNIRLQQINILSYQWNASHGVNIPFTLKNCWFFMISCVDSTGHLLSFSLITYSCSFILDKYYLWRQRCTGRLEKPTSRSGVSVRPGYDVPLWDGVSTRSRTNYPLCYDILEFHIFLFSVN